MLRALALPLMLAVGAPAVAQASADNADVLAAARAFDDAQARGDRGALDRLLAPDFLMVQGSGKVGDRAEFINGFTKPQSKLEPFEVSDRLFLRPSPDTAIVGGETWLRGTDDGKPFRQHFRYSDTFVRRGGQWIVVYSQVTPLPLD